MTDDLEADVPAPPTGAGLGGLRPSVALPVAPVRQGVTDQIRAAILRLELRPGQRLVERELVDATGVSRPTIREALQQLAAEGLVTSTRGRGWTVHEPDFEEAEELYEVRAQLEGMVSRRFAERATDEQVIALQEALEGIAEAVTGHRDSLDLITRKAEFYGVLFTGAEAAVSREIIGGLQARITTFRATTLSQPDRPQKMIDEMREIVAAVVARDPEEAQQACIRHVREAARVALGLMRETS